MTTPQDRLEAEGEINQLVQRYAHAVDVRGPQAQAACFTPGGFLELSSGARRDRAQIAAGPASAGVKRRHFFTAPVIAWVSPDTATGEGFCLILEFDEAVREQGPPLSVDYRDEYRRTSDGWRLASRVISRSFP